MNQPQRLLSVMFADVASSVRIHECLTDLEASHAIQRCMKRMAHCIEGCQGRTLQIIGDELLAAFESPEQASLCAVNMQAHIAHLPPVSGLKLTIRIGLHLGMVTESADSFEGQAILSAARIAALAQPGQILASEFLINSLPEQQRKKTIPPPQPIQLTENDQPCRLFEISWVRPSERIVTKRNPPPRKLRVNYRDQTFTFDAKSPSFSLGRDLDCDLHIASPKASRQHARIECRSAGYFYIDSSTNGSFVAFNGLDEIMLRRDEILLQGSGYICFGSSRNHSKADFISFEHD